MKNIAIKCMTGVMALSTLAGTSSCSSDFLDEDSSHMVLDGILKTEDGILAMSAGLYGNLRWHFGYEWAYATTMYGCDEFTNGADLTSEPWNVYDNRLSPDDCTTANGAANNNCPGVSALWDEMYYGISTANLIIDGADLVSDANSRNKALGEAYFLRGYNYYRLFCQYGGVVLQLKPATLSKEYYRATEEETLNQVIEDFTKAYELLPTDKWRGNGTWTKYTAAHFLAKALLYRQSERCSKWNSKYPADADLNKAIALCDEVTAVHKLEDNYNNLYNNWTGANCEIEKSKEILMVAEHNDNEEGSVKGRFGNRTYSYFSPQFSNFSGGYVQRGQYIGEMDFQRCRPTEYTYSCFDNVNDSRMWKTFKTVYGMNNWATNASDYDDNDEHYPKPGDIGILYLLNAKSYNVPGGTMGRAGEKHTFVNPETGKWVPNVCALYVDGNYDMDKHGVSGNTATCNNFAGVIKVADGSRTAEKGDAHRDVIMARSGETYLVKAECQVRLGKYDEAIATVNILRARASWKNGEDREFYCDGSQAFKNNNSTQNAQTAKKNADFDPKTGAKKKDPNTGKDYVMTNIEAYNYSHLGRNSYYLSTGIERTTAASDLTIISKDQLPKEDEAILAALGCSGDKERLINFILNERTRELLGEWNRWDELSRTNTLIKRAKAFNAEAAANIKAGKHEYRPIPTKFLNTLQHDNGINYTADELKAMQNPGY